MGLTVENIAMLLLASAVVAILAKRLHLPYTVGLVTAGTVLALFPPASQLTLTKDIILTAFLPPLIFEAALNMRWRDLRRDLAVITTLATVGVFVSVAVVAGIMHLFAGWGWQVAALFGILISATDPVAVIATFRETHVKGRLKMLVEAESLFNDGTVAVLFAVALAAITEGTIQPAAITVNFVLTVAGGMAAGLFTGWLALLLSRSTDDHLVVTTITSVAAYGSFISAEHFHCSGVLATLAAGILIGNPSSPHKLSARERIYLENFWEYAAFVINSLVFLLTGLSLAKYNIALFWRESLIAIAGVLAGRAVAVYGIGYPFSFSRAKISYRHQHILFWGGLRGALALALVLGLSGEMPGRDSLLAVTFAVVAFSIIVQGITITPLLKGLGEIKG